jgi:hypothetical protein
MGIYVTPSILSNASSSTFLNDATFATVVLGWIHSVGRRYDLVGTPVMTILDCQTLQRVKWRYQHNTMQWNQIQNKKSDQISSINLT